MSPVFNAAVSIQKKKKKTIVTASALSEKKGHYFL